MFMVYNRRDDLLQAVKEKAGARAVYAVESLIKS